MWVYATCGWDVIRRARLYKENVTCIWICNDIVCRLLLMILLTLWHLFYPFFFLLFTFIGRVCFSFVLFVFFTCMVLVSWVMLMNYYWKKKNSKYTIYNQAKYALASAYTFLVLFSIWCLDCIFIHVFLARTKIKLTTTATLHRLTLTLPSTIMYTNIMIIILQREKQFSSSLSGLYKHECCWS